MFPRLITLLAIVLIAVSVAQPVGAADIPHISLKSALGALDNPGTPAGWSGIWETDMEMRICDFPMVLVSDSYTDTLCAGDPVDPDDQGAGMECTGTSSDTSIDITCTMDGEVETGCMQHVEMTYQATRNGDSYSAHVVINATYTGACDGYEDSCLETDFTGTRVGPAPPTCSTPVDQISWGTLKSHYE